MRFAVSLVALIESFNFIMGISFVAVVAVELSRSEYLHPKTKPGLECDEKRLAIDLLWPFRTIELFISVV